MATLRITNVITPALSTLTALTNVAATGAPGSVTLTWDTPPVLQGVSSVQARWKTTGAFGAWTDLSSYVSGAQQGSVLTLDPGFYTFEVAPVAQGVRGPAVTVTATVPSPDVPSNLDAQVALIDATTVRVRWTGADANVTVELRTGNGSYELIYTGLGGLLPTGERFVDVHELRAGVFYAFRVTEI